MISNIFLSPFVEAFIVPLLLLVIGSTAKMLTRDDGINYNRKDWYMGIELVFVVLTTAFLKIFEFLRIIFGTQSETQHLNNLGDKLVLLFLFLLVIIVFLFQQLILHRRWIEDTDLNKQLVKLGFLSNGIGIGLLATLVIIVEYSFV